MLDTKVAVTYVILQWSVTKQSLTKILVHWLQHSVGGTAYQLLSCNLVIMWHTSAIEGRADGSIAQHFWIISHSPSPMPAGFAAPNIPLCPRSTICMRRLPYEWATYGKGGSKVYSWSSKSISYIFLS